MRTEVTRKRFTVDDYYRMAEAGVFDPDERVELIHGEIVEMSPIGPRHAACVNRLTRHFQALQDRAILSVQNPAHVDPYSVPQPDVLLLEPKEDFYASRLPAPEDVLLMVEVSDATLRDDQHVKVPLYADAGIREVWIVDLTGNGVYVYRDPRDGEYRMVVTVHRGDSISPLAFPDLVIPADAILA